MTRKEVDILYQITAEIAVNPWFRDKTLEETQDWVRKTLAKFKIYTLPVGSSWGSLVEEKVYQNWIKENKTKLWARKCSITGEGMNSGWFIGYEYYKYQKDADEEVKNQGYKDFADLYRDCQEESENQDYAYWTEWEDEEDYNFEEIDEILYERES